MAEQIPGRKIGAGESYFTDWVQRTGDSMALHAEMISVQDSGIIEIAVQTRAEPGATESYITPTYKSSGTGSNLQLIKGQDPGPWLATAFPGYGRRHE
jgi:hypothetical protein